MLEGWLLLACLKSDELKRKKKYRLMHAQLYGFNPLFCTFYTPYTFYSHSYLGIWQLNCQCLHSIHFADYIRYVYLFSLLWLVIELRTLLDYSTNAFFQIAQWIKDEEGWTVQQLKH